MQTRYYKEYSRYLNRDMEFKVYGHAGRPVLVFPCQSGHFYDWEDNGMNAVAAAWIEAGKMQVFCADSIDPESWDNKGPERPRIEMHERWYNYVCEELVPRVLEISAEQGVDYTGKIITGGAGIGGSHAVNFFLRRPDLFGGVISLSGLYNFELFFNDYMDDLLYRNTPNAYMKNLPADHPYIELYNKADPVILCVGQGAWEDGMLPSTKKLGAIFEEKGIKSWVDIWGEDVSHDWPWWRKQFPYFLEKVFGKV